jgi:hypothetical protein
MRTFVRRSFACFLTVLRESPASEAIAAEVLPWMRPAAITARWADETLLLSFAGTLIFGSHWFPFEQSDCSGFKRHHSRLTFSFSAGLDTLLALLFLASCLRGCSPPGRIEELPLTPGIRAIPLL